MRDEDQEAGLDPTGSHSPGRPDAQMTQYRRPGSEQLEHIAAAAKDNPTDPTIWEWYAFTLYGLDRFDDAVGAYRKALELRPENPVSFYYLGNSLFSLDRVPEAVREWQHVVRLAPRTREGQRAQKKLLQQAPEGAPEVPAPDRTSGEMVDQEKELSELGILVQREKIEALAVMAQGICHELNNPLMVVTGFADLLQSHLKDDPRLRAMPEKIKEAGRRCVDVIRRFSNFANRAGLRRTQDVELSHLVEEVLSILSASFKGQAIQVVTKLEMGLLILNADASGLQLSLMSLLSNAREAMPQGGLLEITAQRDEAWARLEIRDNGVGMNQEDLAHLFEPFYTRKRKWEGLGLGMAEAYVTIRQHEGTISCESAPGKGTTMILSLPVACAPVPAPDPDGAAGSATATGSGEAGTGRGARPRSLLLLDEDYDLMYLVARSFEKLGFRVTMTTDVASSLESLHAGQYGLVIIDPLVSGPLLADRLRQIRDRDPDLPVLLTLGMASRVDESFMEELGAARSLAKPYGLDELVSMAIQMTGPGAESVA